MEGSGAAPPPWVAYRDSTSVFVGKATDAGYMNGIVPEATFLIERDFRDPASAGKATVVMVPDGPAADSGRAHPFREGERYLVYARLGNFGNLATPRTRPLAEAAEDLAYLESMATVAGRVERLDDSGVEALRLPIAGARVVVEARGVRFEGATDAGGAFAIPGIPTGTARVALAPLSGFAAVPAGGRALDLAAGERAEVSFNARHDNRFAGTISSDDGRPAAGLEVSLRRLDHEESRAYAITDATGGYGFEGLDPGTYLLEPAFDPGRVDARPFPTTAATEESVVRAWISTGSGESARHALIVVPEGAGTIRRDFRTPSPLRARPVTGVVVLGDGSPVRGIGVAWSRVSPLRESADEARPLAIWTDERGRFALTAYEGVRYRLSARGFDRRTISQSDVATVEIPPDGAVEPLTLRLKTYDR